MATLIKRAAAPALKLSPLLPMVLGHTRGVPDTLRIVKRYESGVFAATVQLNSVEGEAPSTTFKLIVLPLRAGVQVSKLFKLCAVFACVVTRMSMDESVVPGTAEDATWKLGNAEHGDCAVKVEVMTGTGEGQQNAMTMLRNVVPKVVKSGVIW